MQDIYDVLVVGGGFSGAIAAIAAARCGARTLLVEQYGFLGGMLTAAGVGPMMTFHAGETLIVRGIADEVIQRLQRKGLSPGHIFDTTGYTYTVTPFDAEGLKTELEEMALEAGVELLYHTMLADVQVESGDIASVQLCGKAGLFRVRAKVYVDATGDADLSARAGVPFHIGSPSTGTPQAMTMMLRVNNVDVECTRAYIRAHDEEFPRLEHDTHKVDRACRLSIGGFTRTTERAVAEGALSFSRRDVLFFETSNPGEVIINTSHLEGFDNLDPHSLTMAEIEGRRQANELYRMFRKYIPGFEEARLLYTGPFVGVRSSRQIVGLYTLSDDDVYACREFPDAIAFSAYPVDVHEAGNQGQNDASRRFASHAEENRYYWGKIRSLPYRCLVNAQVSNLLTVGRCTSVSYRAQGAFRTAPIVGAIGHAGGLAAALSAKAGIAPRDLDPNLLRETLRADGAYLLD